MKHRKEIVVSKYLNRLANTFIILPIVVFSLCFWEGQRDPNIYEAKIAIIGFLFFGIFTFLRETTARYEKIDAYIPQREWLHINAQDGVIKCSVEVLEEAGFESAEVKKLKIGELKKFYSEAYYNAIKERDQFFKAKIYWFWQEAYALTFIF